MNKEQYGNLLYVLGFGFTLLTLFFSTGFYLLQHQVLALKSELANQTASSNTIIVARNNTVVVTGFVVAVAAVNSVVYSVNSTILNTSLSHLASLKNQSGTT